MKKIITLLTVLISLVTFAQVPQGISYQAIALNTSGAPIVSANVGIRLSVLDNSATGTVLYTETQTKTTNVQGLFNLVIGQGTPSTGTFNTINWGTNLKFLKVEMDVAGGTNYVLVGTTQLLSVPYALAAGSLSGGIDANNSIENNKTSNFCFASNTGNVYAFNSLTNSWVAQSGSVNSSGGLISSNMNFCFASNTGNLYAFNASNNSWVAQSGFVNSSGGLISSNGNFCFASNTGNVYAFNSSTNSWVAQSGSVNSSGGLISSNGNFCFASNTGNVYAFNASTNSWVSQSGSVNSSGGLISSNGNFCFASNAGNVYSFNKKTNVWTVQSGSVNSSGGLISSPSN